MAQQNVANAASIEDPSNTRSIKSLLPVAAVVFVEKLPADRKQQANATTRQVDKRAVSHLPGQLRAAIEMPATR